MVKIYCVNLDVGQGLAQLSQLNCLSLVGYGSVVFLKELLFEIRGDILATKVRFFFIKNLGFEFQKVDPCCVDGPISQ